MENFRYEIYSGAGNDFVMINNLNTAVPQNEQQDWTINNCREHFKELDGVIFIDKPHDKKASIRMNYYNRDGSFGAMCGNGARCSAMFSYKNGMVLKKKFNIEAVDKIYSAEIIDEENVIIGFPKVSEISLNLKINFEGKEYSAHYCNVGSDHLVLFVGSLGETNVESLGRGLRFHRIVMPAGANVNFVKIIDEKKIQIRTYERGVERETLACGTGIISSAIISSMLGMTMPTVNVLVQSGEWLKVGFDITETTISNVTLEGSARKINEVSNRK